MSKREVSKRERRDGSFITWLLDEARSQIASITFQYAWPWAVAAMVYFSGFLAAVPLPLPYLLAATVFAFAMASCGAFFFRQYVDQQNPEGKFAIGEITIGKFGQTEDGKRILKGVKYTFVYSNRATFEIEYEVTPTRVTLGSSINPKPQRDVKGGRIPAGMLGHWSEAIVPVTKEMWGQTIEGDWEFEVTYWRSGKSRQYATQKKARLTIGIAADGSNVTTFDYTNIIDTPSF